MTGFLKPFPGGEFDKRVQLITFSILCPVGLISSQSPHVTLFGRTHLLSVTFLVLRGTLRGDGELLGPWGRMVTA